MEKKNIDWGNIGFGYVQTDYRYVCRYKDGQWDEGGLETEANITLNECACVFQYCQACFEGLKACYIGDGNNMANSLIVGFLKVGAHVSIACPDAYQPDAQILEFVKQYPGQFFMTDKPLEAAKDADVIFTDVWTSMGQEEEKAIRVKAFTGYQINDELMALTNPGCMVQHCLPAHRGEEITEEGFEAHADEIFDEAENRLHTIKAVMAATLA